MTRFFWLALIVFSASCASDPMQLAGDPAPALAGADLRATDGVPFRLRPYEMAASQDESLLIAFRGVRSDSRCPRDVTCVWAGNAEATIGTARDGGHWCWTTLNTGVEPRQVRVNGLTITLLDVEPAAFEGRVIRPDQYVAVLQISRE